MTIKITNSQLIEINKTDMQEIKLSLVKDVRHDTKIFIGNKKSNRKVDKKDEAESSIMFVFLNNAPIIRYTSIVPCNVTKIDVNIPNLNQNNGLLNQSILP